MQHDDTAPSGLKQVAIIGFDQALATAITGIMDLFRMAGVTWARIHEQQPKPHFEVMLATPGGRPCRCVNGLTLQAHCSWENLGSPDVVMLPTIGGEIDRTLAENQELRFLLQHWHHAGVDIASNCTGAFLLADAGLLDHRDATTHWGYCDLFRQRYTRVNLRPHQLITANDTIFCAGGGMAWFDLGLFLVERYCGVEVARTLAKAFVLDMGRQNQAAYASVHARRYHQDQTILAVQQWLDQNLATPIRLDELAERFNLSPRTFKRRFRAATGETPLNYLQSLRVEYAKKLLETPQLRLAQVTEQVGYDDVSSFSRLFRSRTGMTPGTYRSRFVPSGPGADTP